MFTFQWPWLISLLPLPLLIWWFWSAKQSVVAEPLPQIRFPALHRLQTAFTQINTLQSQSRRWWYWLWLWLAWIGLVGALMYPQWLDKHVEIIESGYDIMLAVDLSGSMEQADFYTRHGQRLTRLNAVKLVLGPFIQRRLGDRLGLILFADHAYLQAPLTLDNDAIDDFLQRAVIGLAGRETAIGDAIGLAVKKLRERPEGSRVLILLTDGENTAGSLSPLKAAQLAKQYDIRIYTIGVGGRGDFLQRGVNEQMLTAIAQQTNGAYFSATDFQALNRVYQDIDNRLTKTQAESRLYLQRIPLYHWPLAFALLALLILQILRVYVRQS
jgi:Ca-activated chloride channel family protein